MTNRFIKPIAAVLAAASLLLSASASLAEDKGQIRIGLQKSSTLIAVLRANGELESTGAARREGVLA